jgi:hypothetical protein
LAPTIHSARRAATTDAAAPSEAQPADVVAELDDKDSRHARMKEKQFYGTKGGYQAWLKTGAASQFYDVNPGQKARWLESNNVSRPLVVANSSHIPPIQVSVHLRQSRTSFKTPSIAV